MEAGHNTDSLRARRAVGVKAKPCGKPEVFYFCRHSLPGGNAGVYGVSHLDAGQKQSDKNTLPYKSNHHFIVAYFVEYQSNFLSTTSETKQLMLDFRFLYADNLNVVFRFNILAIFFFFSVSADAIFAAHYQLFSRPGIPAVMYNVYLNRLAPGDTISFSSGKVYKIEKRLGQGNTSLILAVGKNAALRIPLNKSIFARSWFNQYWEGYLHLKDSQIPIVKAYADLNQEFVLVERFQKRFDFGEFLDGGINISETEKARIMSEFIDFASKTYEFARIGDFHQSQLVYTKKGWLLVDWGNDTVKSTKIHGEGAFYDEFGIRKGPFKRLSQYLHGKIKEAIISRRLADRRFIDPCGRIFAFYTKLRG